uniref:Si:ch211-284e13.6 n=1 Tax=Astyanax mexicanus TaxID=7994 RepID=A0A3B1KFU1_ASTMX
QNHRPAVPQMDDRGCLPPSGSAEPRLPTSAIQLERDSRVRQIRREPGDPVTSTHIRKEDLSDVPRKVPRFQYVDFPSLHQCIKQLSVPPLEGWLASCPLGRVQSCQPSSPKEKVPKFKYVDYPSLYHCIQQLSVPPLEIWSSGLTKPGPASGDLRDKTVAGQTSSQVPVHHREKHQEVQGHRAELESRVPIPSGHGVRLHPKDMLSGQTSETGISPRTNVDETPQKPSGSRSESVSKTEPERVATRNERDIRPSVISMVRTERHKHSTQPEESLKRRTSPDPVEQVKRQAVLAESVCSFCLQIFADPEELWNHQRSHKDK